MNSVEYDSSIHLFLTSPQFNINTGSMAALSVLTRLPSVQEMTVTEVVVDSVVAVVVVDMEAVAVVDMEEVVVDTEVAAAMKTTTPVEVTLEVDTLEVRLV